MKNNTFSFSRFGLVLKKDLMENLKQNLMLFVTLIGIMAIIFTFQSLEYHKSANIAMRIVHLNRTIQVTTFIIFLFAGTLYASRMMQPISTKTKRTSYLMLPSSSLEKYLSRWIQVTILYAVFFFIAFYIADLIRMLVCSIVYYDTELQYIKAISFKGAFMDYKTNIFPLLFSFYLSAQSLFVLGSTFWQKNSFVKTFVSCIVINIVFSIIIVFSSKLMFYSSYEFGNRLGRFFGNSVNLSDLKPMIITVIILSVFTIFNWVLAYFRFKETEIINKW